MRVIAASLFIVGGMFVALLVVFKLGVFVHWPPVLVGSGLGLFMVVLSLIAAALFNARKVDQFGLQTDEELIRQLENEGLLVSSNFHARRAFGVEEAEDEGLHYFLELVDGRVLFLTGQYLYDYEPSSEDADDYQPRRFPCTDFTIRRHKTEGYVVETLCKGIVLEPEFIAPQYSERVWRSGRIPEDGQVVSDMTYDEFKALLTEP
jgi:hypothetical protein